MRRIGRHILNLIPIVSLLASAAVIILFGNSILIISRDGRPVPNEGFAVWQMAHHAPPRTPEYWGHYALGQRYGVRWVDADYRRRGRPKRYFLLPTLPTALLLGIPALVATPRITWRLTGLLRRKNRARHGRCPDCGYDLHATPNQCPECGRIAQRRSAV